MNKLIPLFFVLILVSSCKVIPFFIPKETLAKREKERQERIVKRLEKTEDKISKDKGKLDRKIKRVEKLERKLPGDTLVTGLDSVSLSLEKNKLAEVKEEPSNIKVAREIMNANTMQYQTAKLKTKLQYASNGKKQNFNAQFRIEKDKQIWVTITVVGLEVARAIITPDSVKALDKINKRVYIYTFSELVKLINIEIDFNTLQDIIMGEVIGKKGEVYEFTEFGGTINIGVKSADYLNKLTFNKSDSTLRQLQLQVFRGQYASNILGMLGEYQKQNTRFISTKRVYNIEDSRGQLSLEMEVQKIEFDGQESMPFTVPSNYKEIR